MTTGLQWRKEPPTELGWYLTYTPCNEGVFGFDVVQIYQSGGGQFAPLLAATADGSAYEFLPECKLPGKRLWAGPIEVPVDA